MNSINLTGNLTKAVDLKFLPGGDKAVASFSIGVKRPFSKDKSDFINIVVFGAQAESCSTYLDKGSKVAITGYLTSRSYEAKDGGGKRYVTEVIANNVEFLTRKNSNSSVAEDMEPVDVDNSDLPF